jgi:hypothetical protein
MGEKSLERIYQLLEAVDGHGHALGVGKNANDGSVKLFGVHERCPLQSSLVGLGQVGGVQHAGRGGHGIFSIVGAQRPLM